MGWREVLTMGHRLAETVIEHHRRRLKGRALVSRSIDFDPTDDPYGQKEFTFFDGHCDTGCSLPVVASVTFNAEAECGRAKGRAQLPNQTPQEATGPEQAGALPGRRTAATA